MLGVLVFASSAMAAEIMEVRVGRHAQFTRVVFELDRAVGYRIERTDPASGVEELVISFEASSIPRRIQLSKSHIVQVEVEPSGTRSVARIRLAKSGLRLKEMILTSPPRIVLDILSDQKAAPPVAAVVKPKAKPVPIPKEVAVAKVVEPTVKPTVRPTDQPTDQPTDKPTDRVVEQVPAKSKPAPVVEPAPVVVAEPVPEPVPEPAPVVEEPVEVAPEVPEVEVVDEPSTSTSVEEPEIAADSQPASPAPVMPEPQPPRQPRPMVVKSKPATDQGGGWMTWALVGGGVVILLVGGVLVARRFAGGEEVNFADEGDSDLGDAAQLGSDGNPFGELSSDGPQMTLGTDSGDTTIVSPDDEKKSESLDFGDSEEKSMDDMEVISRDQVNESLGAMPSAASAGIPEEFQQLMSEMSRRVESLEGRIDELVDARDRLERQVAAQTEELRVQRAAIARTQRAVRNLARPEDGDGEQEPTEPALRDPNQPGAD